MFSLFNLRDKSRFWSESVFRTGMCSVSRPLFAFGFPMSSFASQFFVLLSDFDDLESSVHSNSGVLNYTKSGK